MPPAATQGADSVPLDATTSAAVAKKARAAPVRLKGLVALFLLFLLVVSDVFVGGVLGGFSGATRGRSPTAYGVVLQGVFLVLFFAVAIHLMAAGVL